MMSYGVRAVHQQTSNRTFCGSEAARTLLFRTRCTQTRTACNIGPKSLARQKREQRRAHRLASAGKLSRRIVSCKRAALSVDGDAALRGRGRGVPGTVAAALPPHSLVRLVHRLARPPTRGARLYHRGPGIRAPDALALDGRGRSDVPRRGRVQLPRVRRAWIGIGTPCVGRSAGGGLRARGLRAATSV